MPTIGAEVRRTVASYLRSAYRAGECSVRTDAARAQTMAPRARLTGRQREAFDYITSYIGSYGFPPTLREIGRHMGIRSTNGVNDHLRALERKGYIERTELQSRAIRVVGLESYEELRERCGRLEAEVARLEAQVAETLPAYLDEVEARHGLGGDDVGQSDSRTSTSPRNESTDR